MCTVITTGASVVDKAEILTDAVNNSRCVLAVISPGFFADECCRFCFENTVRDDRVDVIYVLHGDTLDDVALIDEVRVALRNSRRRFDSPLTETDLIELDDAVTPRNKAVDQFWLKVRLAIPNRREDRAAKQEKSPLLV